MAAKQLCETLLRTQLLTGTTAADASRATRSAILAGGVEARFGRLNESAEWARFRELRVERELKSRTVRVVAVRIID
jgi:hypothetical protein